MEQMYTTFVDVSRDGVIGVSHDMLGGVFLFYYQRVCGSCALWQGR